MYMEIWFSLHCDLKAAHEVNFLLDVGDSGAVLIRVHIGWDSMNFRKNTGVRVVHWISTRRIRAFGMEKATTLDSEAREERMTVRYWTPVMEEATAPSLCIYIMVSLPQITSEIHQVFEQSRSEKRSIQSRPNVMSFLKTA